MGVWAAQHGSNFVLRTLFLILARLRDVTEPLQEVSHFRIVQSSSQETPCVVRNSTRVHCVQPRLRRHAALLMVPKLPAIAFAARPSVAQRAVVHLLSGAVRSCASYMTRTLTVHAGPA